MLGVDTEAIDLFVKSKPSLAANYCGVYAIDTLITEFLDCTQKILMGVDSKLPFAIVNTDPIDKRGTHWISLIRLQD